MQQAENRSETLSVRLHAALRHNSVSALLQRTCIQHCILSDPPFLATSSRNHRSSMDAQCWQQLRCFCDSTVIEKIRDIATMSPTSDWDQNWVLIFDAMAIRKLMEQDSFRNCWQASTIRNFWYGSRGCGRQGLSLSGNGRCQLPMVFNQGLHQPNKYKLLSCAISHMNDADVTVSVRAIISDCCPLIFRQWNSL